MAEVAKGVNTRLIYSKGNYTGKLGSDSDTLWQTYKKLLNIVIEIVELPIKHGDFP